ncbi:MAG: hypothetical protein AAB019_02830 [Planctomycetota bacterium]
MDQKENQSRSDRNIEEDFIGKCSGLHCHLFGVVEKIPESKIKYALQELVVHLPYSVFSVLISFIILLVITFLNQIEHLKDAFHVFHPVHLLLSTTATTAMFWRFDKGLIKAIFIGSIGSVGICSFSDILVPYFGGLVFVKDMQLHLCFIEDPFIIWPFVAVGIVTGLLAGEYLKHSTIFSHSAHVLISTFTSVIYMATFGLGDWIPYLGWIFVVTIIAVMLPCCISDIIFPLLFIRRRQEVSAACAPPGGTLAGRPDNTGVK